MSACQRLLSSGPFLQYVALGEEAIEFDLRQVAGQKRVASSSCLQRLFDLLRRVAQFVVVVAQVLGERRQGHPSAMPTTTSRSLPNSLCEPKSYACISTSASMYPPVACRQIRHRSRGRKRARESRCIPAVVRSMDNSSLALLIWGYLFVNLGLQS